MSAAPLTQNLNEALARWRAGDRSVEKELMDVIYPILRSLAQKQLRGIERMTLQATELANEAFIKLRSNSGELQDNKENFLGFVARVLRNLIVDHMRERASTKRGGALQRVEIEELDDLIVEDEMASDIDWLKLDYALIALEEEDAEHARLVELRYFLGYNIEQSAAHLQVSMSTANRMWRFARAFLFKHMQAQALKQNELASARGSSVEDLPLPPKERLKQAFANITGRASQMVLQEKARDYKAQP